MIANYIGGGQSNVMLPFGAGGGGTTTPNNWDYNNPQPVYGGQSNVMLPVGSGGGGTANAPASGVGLGPLQAPPSTALQTTQQAIGLGQQVYNQLPGYNQSLGNIGQNIQSWTAGVLPPDVLAQIQQGSAESGYGSGLAGSGANSAAYARSLGLSSLQLENMGQSAFQNILPTLPGAGIYENPQFYQTPGQNLQAQEGNLQYLEQQQAQQFEQSQQQAALAAAQQGLNAGLGPTGGMTSGGLRSDPITPPISNFGGGAPDFGTDSAGAPGSGYPGVADDRWYGASGGGAATFTPAQFSGDLGWSSGGQSNGLMYGSGAAPGAGTSYFGSLGGEPQTPGVYMGDGSDPLLGDIWNYDLNDPNSVNAYLSAGTGDTGGGDGGGNGGDDYLSDY